MNNTEIQPTGRELIANALVNTDSVGYSFTHPILWASGTYNPFYVDNRKLQSLPDIRKILRKELVAPLKGKEINYPFGIPTAGIAPATLQALELGKPLLIKLNGLYYSIDLNYIKKLLHTNSMFAGHGEIIAGTVPFGIICGIVAAEEFGLPFIFVREKPKDHGLNKQIEGITKDGASVILMDPIIKGFERYKKKAISAIEDSGMFAKEIWEFNINIFKEDDRILGASLVGTEDLVSTGESMLKEIRMIEEGYTTKVLPVSIVDYKLPSSIGSFEKRGLKNHSVVDFLDIIKAYKEIKGMSLADEERLMDWYLDQPNWGDKNGFPAVSK